MSYSRRQLEAFGEPFGSCATRVKPGGYGRIYGVGNEPEPEGSRPSGEDYYYQTGTMGSGPYGGQPAGFMVANPEYKGAEYVPYTGAGVPAEDSDYYYQTGSMSGPGQYMVANPAYKEDVPAYVPFTPTTTAATSTGGGGGNPTATNAPVLTLGPPVSGGPGFTYIDPNADKAGPPAPVGNLPVVQVPIPVPVPVTTQQVNQAGVAPPSGFLGARPAFTGEYNPFYAGSDTRSDLVNMAYQRLLNRQPDPEGLAYYSQEMTRGLTGQGLVSALANSPEFQRTQDFQRAYTSTFRPGYQEFGPSGQYNQPIYLSNYTNYARSPEFTQPVYNTTMMTPQDVGYGFGSFNPFAYGGTNEFASADTAPASSSAAGGSTAAARGGRIKDDEGIAALLPR